MIELEIDGRKVEVQEGSMVMDAANRLDIYVPHFCYHKKLSIAANCRMCLVEIEKAPKPMPACATPVTAGMIVRTLSDRAKQAQKGVMEFLLINHPLDCPICDQGGECQLQDLAVGYGGSASRYGEPKRVVFHKSVGPLISAEEMTRCIHCTRCVRFGQEVAGVMELGMAGRGEHAEILSFVGRSVDSELSGNMIDICPVGALTSKPFRYAARTWELSRRRSVSPHDSLGANLIVQVKGPQVLRVVPLENEDVNECWLSDRDRFSYEGLEAPDRLGRPLVKHDGTWREVDWPEALDAAAQALQRVRAAHGADAIGALAAPHSTLEELFLLGRLVRGLGSDNIDFRLRQVDFATDGRLRGAPWLGMTVADLATLDRLLLVGSFLRKDHPLMAARIRHAVKHGAKVGIVHAVDDDLLMPLAARAIVAPQHWCRVLAEVAAAVAQATNAVAPVAGIVPSAAATALAAALMSGRRAAVLLGNAAVQHPQAAQLHALAQWIATAAGARLGVLGESASSVGGHLVDAVPRRGGANARTMFETPRRAYLLWNVEPEVDTANAALAARALAAADAVIVCSPFRNGALDHADVILPIVPFTETSGSFINTEGRVQHFNGTVRPFGEARPGWKVLRVLAERLGVTDLGFDTPEALRAAAVPADVATRLSNVVDLDVDPDFVRTPLPTSVDPHAWRVADVPIYATDHLVRRAAALQRTADARPPRAVANRRTLARFGVDAGSRVRVRQGDGTALLDAAVDDRMPDDAVRVSAGHPSTAALGDLFGPITLERA